LAYIDGELKEGSKEFESFSFRLQQLCKAHKDGFKILDLLKQNSSINGHSTKTPFIQKSILFAPLYFLSKWLTPKIVKQHLFFDSISFGLVMFLWPIYLLIIGLLLKQVF
jgi:hypothetical protein